MEPLLKFEWVAGQGEVRESPKVAQFCEPPSWPGARPGARGSSPLRPAATRMNSGFPAFLNGQTSAIGIVFRRPLPGKLSLRSPQDRRIPPTQISTEPKWKDGRSVLVLYDFSREPTPINGFAAFRKHPSLGKGNHAKNAFTLLYFHIESLKPVQVSCHRKEIRRATKA